jgi:hypothetical protein
LINDDARIPRGLLQDYLPESKFEVVRTDEHELRRMPVKRQELCERLIGQLRTLSYTQNTANRPEAERQTPTSIDGATCQWVLLDQ